MKLGFAAATSSSKPKLVVRLDDDHVVDVMAAAERKGIGAAGAAAFASPKAAIVGGPDILTKVRALVDDVAKERKAGADLGRVILAERDLIFHPPIPDPEKFLCVGKNYQAHLDELVRTNLIREIPKEPTGFIKLNSVLVGQNAAVARPDGIIKFDYEPELAFVIGQPAYRVPQEQAMDYVAGITLFNDLTAREIQKREVESGTRFWTAKNMPGFGPIGPYIVTLDEVPDVSDLWLNCRVNGAERMRFNTSGQIHKIPAIIEHFSRYIPLQPGDLFATGSAAGVAIGQANADELFLRPGDVMEIAIEGFLTLRNKIV